MVAVATDLDPLCAMCHVVQEEGLAYRSLPRLLCMRRAHLAARQLQGPGLICGESDVVAEADGPLKGRLRPCVDPTTRPPAAAPATARGTCPAVRKVGCLSSLTSVAYLHCITIGWGSHAGSRATYDVWERCTSGTRAELSLRRSSAGWRLLHPPGVCFVPQARHSFLAAHRRGPRGPPERPPCAPALG